MTCKTEADRAILEAIIDGDASDHDKHDLAARLQAAGIPAGPVTIAPDILADPQVSDRRYFVRLERDDLPSTPMPGSPMVIDGDFERSYWRVAPRLGEHNRQVLKDWLGYEASETAPLGTRRRAGRSPARMSRSSGWSAAQFRYAKHDQIEQERLKESWPSH